MQEEEERHQERDTKSAEAKDRGRHTDIARGTKTIPNRETQTHTGTERETCTKTNTERDKQIERDREGVRKKE